MVVVSTAIAPELVARFLPATIAQRIGALLVDLLLFCALVLAPAGMISYWFGPAAGIDCTIEGSTESCLSSPESIRFARTVGYPIAAAWVPLYAWTIARGASIGKRATEIMVIDDATGQTIGFGRALLRTVLAVLGFVCFGIGLLYALGNRKRRALHDVIVGTRVISP